MEIKKHPERALILRVHLVEGEVGNEKFDLGYSAGGLVWYFHKEERFYSITFRDLTEAVLKFRNGG